MHSFLHHLDIACVFSTPRQVSFHHLVFNFPAQVLPPQPAAHLAVSERSSLWDTSLSLLPVTVPAWARPFVSPSCETNIQYRGHRLAALAVFFGSITHVLNTLYLTDLILASNLSILVSTALPLAQVSHSSYLPGPWVTN